MTILRASGFGLARATPWKLPMTHLTHQHTPADISPAIPAGALARRLAAAGLGVQYEPGRDECRLTILGVRTGRSCVTLAASGRARWLYEPIGPAISPANLAAIIAYLLGVPHSPASLAAYRAFPLKGQVGRALQDQGLTVTLRVSEDWDSFEATTDIDITSPARPWLGAVTLSDDATLDWSLNWQAAFRGDAAALINTITPILRRR
jgi:hypothetical protein